jgi:hypothetical protein
MLKDLFSGKSDKSTSYYFKKLIVAQKLTHYTFLIDFSLKKEERIKKKKKKIDVKFLKVRSFKCCALFFLSKKSVVLYFAR